MDELLEQFLIEGRDLVVDAQKALDQLARDAEDQRAIHALFRATHTLKGSVALFDMVPAQSTMHAAETLLDRTRRGDGRIDPAGRLALLSAIDQLDRWIDAMEVDGKLGDDAGAIAQRLLAALGESTSTASVPTAIAAEWMEELRRRPNLAGRVPSVGTAFRYIPDAECFFRGEDPMAIVAAVPGLAGIAILPADDWPDLPKIDSFRCMVTIEGVSTAGIEEVRGAFRLVPDQVQLAIISDETIAEESISANPLGEASSQLLRVEGAKLDELAHQVGALGAAMHGLDAVIQRSDAIDRSLSHDLRRAQAEVERMAVALRRSIADVRLVSLAPVLRRLPRLAREVAMSLGKDILFDMAGEGLQADKQIADALFEPLLHLIRNAIDHGVELPAERAAAGKPLSGAVRLRIAPYGDRLVVTLEDDGNGMDPVRIRSTALAKGLLNAEAAEGLSDAQALRLIFLPGFSTAANVSPVSGRGVGMDAVQNAIERLQGTIDIESTIGQGTIIRISLPQNTITTALITVHLGGALYGLRIDQITETVRVATSDIQPLGQGEACVVRDRTLPVIDLATALGHLAPSRGDHVSLVITEVTGEPVALLVDRLGARLDGMVRAGQGLLSSIPALSGTTMFGDGTVLLVLDLPELIA